MVDIRLFYHYTTVLWKTITDAGIAGPELWRDHVVNLAFEHQIVMRSILTFAASHLSRTQGDKFGNAVTVHRGEALRLLREEVQRVSANNLDALVAASLLLILDSLANASLPQDARPWALPASAWLHHVRGAATIILAVVPLPPESKFYRLVNIDLFDLAAQQLISAQLEGMSSLECLDEELRDLYPIHTSSPYFQTLAFLDKIFHQQDKRDFILRLFSYPVFLDENMVSLVRKGDMWAKRIIRVYYKLLRLCVTQMVDRVWFVEGVARALPIDMDAELGGLGFVTAPLMVQPSIETILAAFDESISAADDSIAATEAHFELLAVQAADAEMRRKSQSSHLSPPQNPAQSLSPQELPQQPVSPLPKREP